MSTSPLQPPEIRFNQRRLRRLTEGRTENAGRKGGGNLEIGIAEGGVLNHTLRRMVRRAAPYLVTQQAAMWPGSACFCSRGGASIWHLRRTRNFSPADSISTVSAALDSAAACLVRGHLGWNAQP